MSVIKRHSELFFAQDFEVIYRAFTNINFNASDPPSINLALRTYLSQAYPEDYNDWIESSEFVAIIDALSWLAGVLALKTDINARENFLETAEARESVLRLARFLSYNARRNQCARGLLKIVSVRTNDDVLDAFNNNLNNTEIVWNDPNDADWFERMTLILNEAFITTNPFGAPLKESVFAGIRTGLYRVNNNLLNANFAFTKNVAGVDMPFEVINLDFDDLLGFVERAPNAFNAMHVIHRMDGRGNTSPNTGFYVGFKQGQFASQTFSLPYPQENQVIPIDVDNINQSDVWVQTVNDNGQVVLDWTKVPTTLPTENVTFNSLPADQRNIFSVITRDRDQVTVRFADGRFGNAPVGNIRVSYRTSNGLLYQIRPADLTNIKISLDYVNSNGTPRTLNLTLQLEESVSNSAPTETIEQVRSRAPQVYSTNNRMVSGSDYNALPLESNLAAKIKGLVRVYSGQSRHIDLNDPTGTYRPTVVFGDDGMFYAERADSYTEVVLMGDKTTAELVSTYIQPALMKEETVTFMRDFLVRTAIARQPLSGTTSWQQVSDDGISSTGYFTGTPPAFSTGSTLELNVNGRFSWIAVTSLVGSPSLAPVTGIPGPVKLARSIPTGASISRVLQPYDPTLPARQASVCRNNLDSKLSFSIWYDPNQTGSLRWAVREFQPIGANPILTGTSILVMTVEYLGGDAWRFATVGARYCFESMGRVHFYADGTKAVDPGTGNAVQDFIRILSINSDLNGAVSLGRDFDLGVGKMIFHPNGSFDTRRISVTPFDSNLDGYADDPDVFFRVTALNDPTNYLFWRRTLRGFVPETRIIVFQREAQRLEAKDIETGALTFQIESGSMPNSFWVKTDDGWTPNFRDFRFARGRGPNRAALWVDAEGRAFRLRRDSIKFQWNRYPTTNRRIDPSRTNIIDMFVLPTEYDFLARQWIANGAVPSERPLAPSETTLRQMFAEFEARKMFSDEIVWRPVQYRYLFGPGSNDALRATFKVVKLQGATLSDGEIKARVIGAISEFFNPAYWDFGETFYFTELAAYVHQRLAAQIASIVIVPTAAGESFGDKFEVVCRPDELFISTAQVTDVMIIDANTPANLRMR